MAPRGRGGADAQSSQQPDPARRTPRRLPAGRWAARGAAGGAAGVPKHRRPEGVTLPRGGNGSRWVPEVGAALTAASGRSAEGKLLWGCRVGAAASEELFGTTLSLPSPPLAEEPGSLGRACLQSSRGAAPPGPDAGCERQKRLRAALRREEKRCGGSAAGPAGYAAAAGSAPALLPRSEALQPAPPALCDSNDPSPCH
ncbi:uncharacterized protein LJ264_006077 [Porphyrio hochstetteri]